ncbi:MAG: FIST N-terminal domain-containing protein [Archangium sp.]|nr:FIST N-terminal domain-containing protein [Archangium sp.]MDP3574926.1 FIST N-terminal domain-containing protein [Archangium sp.]
MTTRIATARSTSATDAAPAFLELQKQLGGAEPSLVVVFASTSAPLEGVMKAAAHAFPKANTIGCTTAGEFTEASEGKAQFVAWALAGDDVTVTAGLGTGLKADPEAALESAIKLAADDAERPHRMAILLLDPLSGNGEEASMLAMTMLGPTVRLAGGAAGDDLHFKQTLVACGNQVASDAVVVALLSSRRPLGIGVKHGHKPMSKPLTVTKAEGSVVHELDGKPAFGVWKDAVRAAVQAEGADIDAIALADVGGHLLRYEVGLIAGANEYKIRAPLSADAAGAVSFACGIPEGAVVRITSSAESDQISSARDAAERARKALGGAKVAGALVFDCICRNLILGPKFGAAVKEIHEGLGGAPIAGFETYGEIAMDLGQSSGFHNTTTVVLAFPA